MDTTIGYFTGISDLNNSATDWNLTSSQRDVGGLPECKKSTPLSCYLCWLLFGVSCGVNLSLGIVILCVYGHFKKRERSGLNISNKRHSNPNHYVAASDYAHPRASERPQLPSPLPEEGQTDDGTYLPPLNQRSGNVDTGIYLTTIADENDAGYEYTGHVSNDDVIVAENPYEIVRGKKPPKENPKADGTSPDTNGTETKDRKSIKINGATQCESKDDVIVADSDVIVVANDVTKEDSANETKKVPDGEDVIVPQAAIKI